MLSFDWLATYLESLDCTIEFEAYSALVTSVELMPSIDILEKFGEYGPELLSILTYTRPIAKEFRESNNGEDSDELIIEADSALHLALTGRHALNVDLILEKMSIANSDEQVKDASKHFKDIFHELVDYQNFKMYLTSIMNTTPEMEQ